MAITSTSSAPAPVFTASGLASGMDTSSIVNQLVALESQPITLLQNQQAAVQTQVSALGAIASALSSLQSAADDLGQNGAAASTASTSSTDFTATPGTQAIPGRYSVEVDQLAQAAKWRSTGLASDQTVEGGTLTLTVQGKTYDPITIQDGSSLSDLASAIRQSGAPVSAAVLNDGTRSYLSLTAQDTGFPPGLSAADALGVSFRAGQDASGNPLPQTGQDPGFSQIQAAQNAVVTIDQLKFTRQSNVITDALPGTTLNLTAADPGQAEDLVLTTSAAATQQRLQTFADAYNGVMSLIQKQLNVDQGTDRSTSLVGFSSIRSLQAQLQQALVTQVPGLSTVRTLADLGFKTNGDDGSLSIDTPTLENALARDPAAVNQIFSTAQSGISSLVDSLVDLNTRPADGAISIDEDSLKNQISSMNDEISSMQERVDSYRQSLLAQFTAMETTVSQLKTMGSYLTAWANGGSTASSSTSSTSSSGSGSS